jgi:type III secretory pathway lipoprotein EscJ
VSARLVLGCALLLLANSARAEPLSAGQSPLAQLIPGPHERVREEERTLEHKLASALSALDGVADARVVLTLPRTDEQPLDRPLPGARASVLLMLSGTAPEAESVKALVRGAARPLGTADVTITHTRVPTPARASEPLVSVGPFRVSARTAPGLRAVLAASLLANVTLATFLIVRLRRRSRAQRAY